MKQKRMVTAKVILLLLASILVCVLNCDVCVSSPESYYQDAVSRSLKQWTLSAEEIYARLQESMTGSGGTRRLTCRFVPGDTLKALTGDLGLESASLLLEGKKEGFSVLNRMTFQLNDQDALHLNGCLDIDTRVGMVQISEFSQVPLEFGEWLDDSWEKSSQEEKTQFFMMGDMSRFLPQAEELSAMSARYREIILEKNVSVKRSRGSMEAGGVSTKVTTFTADYSGEVCYQICLDILKNMERDVHDIAIGMKEKMQAERSKLTWEEQKEMRLNGGDQKRQEQIEKIEEGSQKAIQTLRARQRELEDAMEQFFHEQSGITVQIFVDSLGNIVGRRVSMTISEETVSVHTLFSRKGMKFGCDCSVNVNNISYLHVTGNGSIQGGKITGDFDVSLEESLNPDPARIESMEHVLQLSVRNLDLQALKRDHEIRGEVEIATEQIPAWKHYRLHISMDHIRERSHDTIQIMAGDTVFVTLDVKSEAGEEKNLEKEIGKISKKKTCNIADLGELANYVNGVEWEKILDDVEKRCGVSLDFLRQ